MARSTQTEAIQPTTDPAQGLFRTALAGRGHTLSEAFEQLELGHHVERVFRHTKRNLFGARVHLASDEGEGYWDFTRIRDQIYVVIGNFVYKDPRVELLPGDGLVQFYFKLSGDLTMAITRAEALHLDQPSLLIYHQPAGTEISEWIAPSAYECERALKVDQGPASK
jgi:hypothetical protein